MMNNKCYVLFENELVRLVKNNQSQDLIIYQLLKNKGRKNQIVARVVVDSNENIIKHKYIQEYKFIKELLLIFGFDLLLRYNNFDEGLKYCPNCGMSLEPKEVPLRFTSNGRVVNPPECYVREYNSKKQKCVRCGWGGDN